MILSLLLGIYVQMLNEVYIFFVIISILWGIIVFTTYRYSTLIIKKKRVILRTGFLTRQLIDISMVKIESIDIRQSILGSILHYGVLIITGVGGTRQYITYLDKPLTCRRYIEQALHD